MVKEFMKAATLVVGLGSTSAIAQDLDRCHLIQSGEASWYGGPLFDGKTTAHGDTFNQNAMTAAHNSLPGGTEVWVENKANGRAVEVTINDTGGFGKYNRILDASKGVAKVLGYENAGHTKVNLYIC